MNKYLIVGSGISGAVLANLIANKLNEKVLVIDRRNHIAGNCYDYKNEYGITIQKYGAHIFHTNIKEVWDYLSQFTKWNYFYNKVQAVIEGNKVSIPFTLKTLRELFSNNMSSKLEDKLINYYGYNRKISILDMKNNDDKDIQFLYEYIYENIFKNYTIKQWELKPEEISPETINRVPVIISNDTRYFQDKYQGIPINGYTNLINNILSHKNIELELNTDFKNIKDISKFKKIFYTGAIDEFFDYKYGYLEYRSLKFDTYTLDKEYYQNTAVTNYPNDYDFTRIIEHKYFLDEQSDRTTISVEYPQKFELGKNERYYTVNDKKSNELYQKYINESKHIDNLHFLGRLGDYKYYNIDSAVNRSMLLFKELLYK